MGLVPFVSKTKTPVSFHSNAMFSSSNYSASVLNESEIRALDAVFEESQKLQEYSNQEHKPQLSSNFIDSKKRAEQLEIQHQLGKKLTDLENQIKELEKELEKDIPENIFVELMILKRNDIQRSQRNLWNRYQEEKKNIEESPKENDGIYRETLENLKERYKKPYIKLNLELENIQKKFKSRIVDVKKDLWGEIKKLKAQIKPLTHEHNISTNLNTHNLLQICEN